MTPTDAKTYWRTLIRDEPETALAIAKECPKVAGRWETRSGLFSKTTGVKLDSEFYSRRFTGKHVGIVHVQNGEIVASVDGVDICQFDTIDEAKSACDAKLRELGYLLEGEG